jgi:predicted DNA-binding WGR domain protein
MIDVYFQRLEARQPSRNICRFYEVAVGRDLFDLWTVVTRNGRIGRRGQQRSHAVESLDAAHREVDLILRKRASAPRRIGTEYRVVEQRAWVC